MSDYSADIRYASAQLGLEAGASLDEARQVLANATAYRYFTKARLACLQHFVDFFAARARLGAVGDSFADIRKAYHHKAMRFHPDRNKGSKAAEEQLKALNADFELIDIIQREARDYFLQDEATRRASEDEARRAREKETPPGEARQEAAPDTSASSFARTETQSARARPENAPPSPVMPRRYMAASVPRFLRQSRLGYLPLQCVIGSRFVRDAGGHNLVFDVIMLPANEFQRMRTYVGLQHIATPELRMGAFNPGFALRDARMVTIPADETDAQAYARNHFLAEFGLLAPTRKQG